MTDTLMPRARPLGRALTSWLCAASTVVAAATSIGCVGGVGGDDDDDADGGTVAAGGGEDGQSGPQGLAVGETPLRRLTVRQYEAALVGLVGPIDLTFPRLAGASPGRLEGDVLAQAVSSRQLEALLDDAEAAASLAVSGEIAPRYDACAAEGTVDRACAESFLRAFARAAYRGPVDDVTVDLLLATFDGTVETELPSDGLQAALVHTLLRPEFLYRVEIGGTPTDDGRHLRLAPHEVANRLAFELTDAPPSAALLQLAESGALDDPEGVRAAAEGLIFDDGGAPRPEAEAAVQRFFEGWFLLDASVAPGDGSAGPDDLGALWREEARGFVREVVWGRRGGLPGLVDADAAYVNGPLAAHYGIEGVSGDDFRWVETSSRPGILLQGWALAKGSGNEQTSPIRRGHFVLSRILCQEFSDPPPGAIEALSQSNPSDSTRERVEETTADPSCQGCHLGMNAVGFALEPLGPLGAWRETENGHPIDAEVDLGPLGLGGVVDGPVELSDALARSEAVSACGAQWLHRWIKGQAPGSADAPVIEVLREAGDGFIDQLLAHVASDDFLHVQNPSER